MLSAYKIVASRCPTDVWRCAFYPFSTQAGPTTRAKQPHTQIRLALDAAARACHLRPLRPPLFNPFGMLQYTDRLQFRLVLGQRGPDFRVWNVPDQLDMADSGGQHEPEPAAGCLFVVVHQPDQLVGIDVG